MNAGRFVRTEQANSVDTPATKQDEQVLEGDQDGSDGGDDGNVTPRLPDGAEEAAPPADAPDRAQESGGHGLS